MDIHTFSDADFEDTVSLVSQAHATHLRAEPGLDASPAIEQLLRADVESGKGWVARERGRLVGLLIGVPGGGAFGPHVRYNAHGAVFTDPSLVAPLFATASAEFLRDNLTEQYVFVPNLEASIDPWFDMDFGTSAFQAVQESQSPVRHSSHRVTVRRGTPKDRTVAASMNREMDLHIQRPPSFGTNEVGDDQEYFDEWDGTWDDSTFVHLVAELDDDIVGQFLLYRRPSESLRVPSSSIDVAQAYVTPRVRRQGVVDALMRATREFAATENIEWLITDWRAGNIPAALVWPAHGFRLTYRRLHRSIRTVS